VLAVFTKPLDLVVAADIAELTAENWPEGYQVEFKEALSVKRGGQHPWFTGGEVGDHARDDILAEVIAFANAHGGSVVLGIEETQDKPPRAHAIVPLPRVGELARRFEDQARSCIDPPLPRLQVRAIETDGQRAGVVIFRVSPSRAAPHRLTRTRESFVRRGSSSVRMTMREIQDMTLNVARGLAGIDASFKERQNAFVKWTEPQREVIAYRVTAPLRPCRASQGHHAQPPAQVALRDRSHGTSACRCQSGPLRATWRWQGSRKAYARRRRPARRNRRRCSTPSSRDDRLLQPAVAVSAECCQN
jgi:schlafen family protein